MNITLEGKRALITGGNSGIGAAIAVALAPPAQKWRSIMSAIPKQRTRS
jgi:NAD(P)-dependent dehydrogenase (short-subunit alcohol dehydrogenase family)